MNYLEFEEMLESGNAPPQVERALSMSGYAFNTGSIPLVANAARRDPREVYWKGNTPVMEKAEYNGETVMLPRLVPMGEKEVSIKKVFLDRTIDGIKHHQGGSKVTWAWKVNLLEDRLSTVAPALLMQARNILPSILNVTTLNVFSYSDATLHGNSVNTELAIDDPADPNGILDASRAACRWIGLTLTFAPQNAIANGRMVAVDQLPEAASIRIYMRAPTDDQGLHASITKAILTTTPAQILQMFVNSVFTAIKHGQIPMKDVFDSWMSEQIHQTYFAAMGQLAFKMFIGVEVATDTLKQRFHRLSQRRWNNATRKNDFLSVNEFYNEIVALTNEAKHLDPADVDAQVPELDGIFYQGLVSRLKEKATLAALTQHNPSTNLGENLSRLQAIVNAAKEVEKEINQIVAISTSTGQFRRTPIIAGGSASSGNTYIAAALSGSADTMDASGTMSSLSTPVRVGDNTVLLTHNSPQMQDVGIQNVVTMNTVETAMTPIRYNTFGTSMTPDRVGTLQAGVTYLQVPAQNLDNVFSLLSNAEQALRRSSNTNAPLQCWGCQGLHPDANHLYRDCPHRMNDAVQANFQKNLQEYLQRKKAARESRFDPNDWKKDGFASAKASSLFNGIVDASNGPSREYLVAEFVHENNKCAPTSLEKRVARTRKAARLNEDGDRGPGVGQPAVALPCWVLDDEDDDDAARSFGAVVESSILGSHAISSYQFGDRNAESPIRYPIASELPHVVLPVGRKGEATVEGLLDTGGACTMGDLIYWREVAARCPHLVAQFEELSDHQEKPISIGGVGAGKVEITHLLGLWLPWMVGNQDSKLVIGLGANMPVTLLIGLPFQIATQCVMDIGQLKCHSVVFNATWKLTLKVPHKKTVRVLDAAVASPNKRMALTTSVTPSKKVRWEDLEVVSSESDQE